MKHLIPLLAAALVWAGVCSADAAAQSTDLVHYTGTTMANPDYHHGQLQPAIGVHNQQIMRANRDLKYAQDGYGWTYNHAPMIAYWKGSFYVEYLSDPVGEHVPPAQTYLMSSRDGVNWTNPVVIFPPYKVPEGFRKSPDGPAAGPDLMAVMHQRVGFYTAKSGRFFALAYYGVALEHRVDGPNDGNGIGRVIREIKEDGTYGPIYFLRYNHGFNEKNTDYPFYTRSRDKGFKAACEEILANPLYTMQMVEEADADDPLIPLHNRYQAMSYYHLDDGRVVALWKHALTSVSADGGYTWSQPVNRAFGFVNSNAKIWGQRTSDGRYATIYNPSEYRWPLAISTSDDGLEYKDLMLVHGEITPERYGGDYKNRGPQYVRGIQENNGDPGDGKIWLTYSMNKEDIWVSSVPVPVVCKAAGHSSDVFNEMPAGHELDYWNTYNLVWAPTRIETDAAGVRALTLRDRDPFDYAKAEKVIPAGGNFAVSMDIQAGQTGYGTLQIELQDAKGLPSVRLGFESEGIITVKNGQRYGTAGRYEPGKTVHIEITVDCAHRSYTTSIDGSRPTSRIFYSPAASLERIVFRTGAPKTEPTPEYPAERYTDMENADGIEPQEAVFRIYAVSTSATGPGHDVLRAADYRHYVDYFNTMEPEPDVKAISNAESWDWMQANVPLFSCPQPNIEEIWYFRWWSWRKSIRQTPQGYIINEFQVDRSYADKYNMIACAIGHHVFEGRWLRNPAYIDQYLDVWFHGKDGGPMDRLHNFSSWTPYAVWQRYLVTGDKAGTVALLGDLEADFKYWEETHQHPGGLFWQRDVSDGMEESISGGRRVQNARPTINSYMFGNARALSKIAAMAGDQAKVAYYADKAVRYKAQVQDKLWNPDHEFFETFQIPGDSLAQAREAIGFIPWYFELPDAGYEAAWKQILDDQGFHAPYGLTTAERRHPAFRSHGVGTCEWDGAVWPFATSQTLTALANVLNDYHQDYVTREDYANAVKQYAESTYRRGRPYIGEYLDEVTGYWLKGEEKRSDYYNHSTYADLIITGLMGLRPREDEVLEVNPLTPADWDWFCLDGVAYRGHNVTIVWDRDGHHYGVGPGMRVIVDGVCRSATPAVTKVEIPL
ncbi:MAG: exo-alpha-sialidase [Bacteroidales bacterium]|nr:exo-alpha-sialidase [Bacteroidales bacterium]